MYVPEEPDPEVGTDEVSVEQVEAETKENRLILESDLTPDIVRQSF